MHILKFSKKSKILRFCGLGRPLRNMKIIKSAHSFQQLLIVMSNHHTNMKTLTTFVIGTNCFDFSLETSELDIKKSLLLLLLFLQPQIPTKLLFKFSIHFSLPRKPMNFTENSSPDFKNTYYAYNFIKYIFYGPQKAICHLFTKLTLGFTRLRLNCYRNLS